MFAYISLLTSVVQPLKVFVFANISLLTSVVEPLAVFVFAYISYLVAEMFHFSGIIR